MARMKAIDYEEVKRLASIGLTDEQIATSIGVSRSTIARRKRDDDTFDTAITEGKQSGITQVVNSLFNAATDATKPNVSAAIFYLKNRGQGTWRDRTVVDANVQGDVTVNHDIDAALQALKEAGVDTSKL